MKVGRDYAWWVSYSWTYEWFDDEDNKWICDNFIDCDAERFYCRKKDIMKEAVKRVQESLEGIKYRNLEVRIDDSYMTTPEEL